MKKKDKFSISMPFDFEDANSETPPKISGFGIHPGFFNRVVEIQDDELDNIERTLKTAQIRRDHSDDPLDVLGKVNEAYKTFNQEAQKEGVFYSAELDQDDDNAMKLYGKIQKGYIDASSIGFRHDSMCSKCGEDFHTCEHWFDEAHVIAKNCEVFELSIVAEGADGDATAKASGFSKNKFISQFKKQFESKLSRIEEKEEDKVMEPGKENPSVDLTGFVKKEDVTTMLSAKDDEINQLKKQVSEFAKFKTDFEDAQKQKVDNDDKAMDAANKEIDALKLAVAKSRVEPIADRKIAAGLAKKEDRDAEVEKLAKADEDYMSELLATLDILEANKLKQQDNNGQGPQGKVPVIDQFKKEDGSFDDKDPSFMQCMVHTIFHYERVYTPDGSNIEGRSYMGL